MPNETYGIAKAGSFYLFNVVGRIDSIIESKSHLTAAGRGQIDGWEYTRPTGPWHCALDRRVIAGRACWTEVRYARRWFFSDGLVQLLKKQGLSGFTLNEYCAELDPE